MQAPDQTFGNLYGRTTINLVGELVLTAPFSHAHFLLGRPRRFPLKTAIFSMYRASGATAIGSS